MANLLAEGYRRLFKGKRFYIVMAVMAGIGVLLTLLYAMINGFFSSEVVMEADTEEVLVNFKYYANDILFSNDGLLVLLVGITAGLLIIQDFRNNTVRNKIIVGHSRVKIYLANWIVSFTVMLIYEAVYLLVVCIFGGIMLGFREVAPADLTLNIVLLFLIETAMVSIIVFLCMTMRNIGGFVLSISMHYVVSMFSLGLLALNKHPKIKEIIMEAVPSYQMNLIDITTSPEHPTRMALFMLCIVLISTVGGILIFKKSDLK